MLFVYAFEEIATVSQFMHTMPLDIIHVRERLSSAKVHSTKNIPIS